MEMLLDSNFTANQSVRNDLLTFPVTLRFKCIATADNLHGIDIAAVRVRRDAAKWGIRSRGKCIWPGWCPQPLPIIPGESSAAFE
jgi:hypothetical protein